MRHKRHTLANKHAEQNHDTKASRARAETSGAARSKTYTNARRRYADESTATTAVIHAPTCAFGNCREKPTVCLCTGTIATYTRGMCSHYAVCATHVGRWLGRGFRQVIDDAALGPHAYDGGVHLCHCADRPRARSLLPLDHPMYLSR